MSDDLTRMLGPSSALAHDDVLHEDGLSGVHEGVLLILYFISSVSAIWSWLTWYGDLAFRYAFTSLTLRTFIDSSAGPTHCEVVLLALHDVLIRTPEMSQRPHKPR